ncbi:esterase-like activity of phytase family protein [Acaryochloris sp. IP29b_bin.148]|uniref:esterase-like activity of phytase family protein n=1 Tax=Acaryochloris sp. IP29b_bin.148 TaxID=2969218 RepID=UPI00260466BE|nr:esterase-like activity of phytase family protein [Acaryochloris sp. IP29b_bin.148]
MIKLLRWMLPLLCCVLLVGCSLPQVKAEDRVFLNLSLDYLGDYQLYPTEFDNTPVGGISALTYDRKRDRIYALSDDRTQPRFYTLQLQLDQSNPDRPQLKTLTLEDVTLLKDEQAQPYAVDQIDPEGLALTPQDTLWISSEGVAWRQSPPALMEFDRQGQWQQQLPLPKHFLAIPATDDNPDPPPHGIDNNRGFEALTLSPEGDRIFAVTEAPLQQDYPDPQLEDPEEPRFYNRLLHYWLGEPQPQLLAEYLYPLQPAGLLKGINGLTELLSVDNGGHFLSLERSYSPITGFNAQIFQITTALARDTSKLDQIPTELAGITPIQKQSLFELKQLRMPVSNLEGMTWGPVLADGSPSLVLVSDNNFDADQPTQFLLFRLRQNRQRVS